MLQDTFASKHGRASPWLPQDRELLFSRVLGHPITKLSIARTQLELGFGNGAVLSIDEDPASRPFFEGNGRPRVFEDAADLRDDIFLSPTCALWI